MSDPPTGWRSELDELRLARTFGSRSPGHPELGHTAGVETTNGPLGQGVGNALGMAMNRCRHAAMLDPGTEARDSVFGHRVWCFASDGDLEEGLSDEASSLAGTLGLEGLILVWDDNQNSIEGDTAIAFTADVAARHRAYGWEVVTIDDAEDPDTIRRGYAAAAAAHAGTLGADEVAATMTILGIDPDASFLMPQTPVDDARLVGERGTRNHAEWNQSLAAWAEATQSGSALLEELGRTGLSDEARAAFATLRVDPQQAATRVASSFAPHAPDSAQWPGGASHRADVAARCLRVESRLGPGRRGQTHPPTDRRRAGHRSASCRRRACNGSTSRTRTTATPCCRRPSRHASAWRPGQALVGIAMSARTVK